MRGRQVDQATLEHDHMIGVPQELLPREVREILHPGKPRPEAHALLFRIGPQRHHIGSLVAAASPASSDTARTPKTSSTGAAASTSHASKPAQRAGSFVCSAGRVNMCENTILLGWEPILSRSVALDQEAPHRLLLEIHHGPATQFTHDSSSWGRTRNSKLVQWRRARRHQLVSAAPQANGSMPNPSEIRARHTCSIDSTFSTSNSCRACSRRMRGNASRTAKRWQYNPLLRP